MQITEKDIEDLIFNDLVETGGIRIKQRNLSLSLLHPPFQRTVWHRQVTLGDYGICDIVGFARHHGMIHVDLIELKNRPLKSEDFNQLMRYKTGIRSILRNSFSNPRFHIYSYLIGPEIEDGHYIHNDMDVSVFTFNFSLDGFRFRERSRGWIRSSSENIHIHDIHLEDGVIVENPFIQEEEEEEVEHG